MNNLNKETEEDETTFLLSNLANKKMLLKSIEEDKNGESLTVIVKEDKITN